MKKSKPKLTQAENNTKPAVHEQIQDVQTKRKLGLKTFLLVFIFILLSINTLSIINLSNRLDKTEATDYADVHAKLEQNFIELNKYLNETNANKTTEPQVTEADRELLIKASNKLHIAIFAKQVLNDIEQDKSMDPAVGSLEQFAKGYNLEEKINLLKTYEGSPVYHHHILEELTKIEELVDEKSQEGKPAGIIGMVRQKIQQTVVITEKEQALKNEQKLDLLNKLKLALEHKNYLMAIDLLNKTDLPQFEQLKFLIIKKMSALAAAQSILDGVLIND